LETSDKKAEVKENLWIYVQSKFVEQHISLLPVEQPVSALSTGNKLSLTKPIN